MRAAVSFEAGFALIAAGRSRLAVADRVHPACRDALSNEVLSDGIGAAVAQTEIVFFAAALVAVTFDGETNSRVLLQPFDIAL
jgi:hypothetical protein